MADNVTVANGALDPFVVNADEAADGSLVQNVKLSVSADGDATRVPADIGNGLLVNVSKIVPGTGSTNLGKSEDAPATSGDTGVPILVVRRTAASAAVSADGDYAMLNCDDSGNLRVAVTGGGGGSQQFAEDAVAGNGDLGTLMLVVRKDVAGTTVSASGDYAALQVDANGYLRTTGLSDLYGPSEYTVDDVLPVNPVGPLVLTRKRTTLTVTTPADDDAQGLRSDDYGALWTVENVANHPYGDKPVKRAFLNVASGQTDAVLVAAVAAKKIRVLQVALMAGTAATDVTFNSKPAGAHATISPLFSVDAHGGFVMPFSLGGWIETANVNEGLTVTTSASGQPVGVLVAYAEI